MKRQPSNSVFVTATVLIAVVTLFFGIYQHGRERDFRIDILHSRLQLNNFQYLTGSADKDIRITVIDTLGRVLFDSEESDVSHMGNHIHRKEIQEALSSGVGYDIKRVSETDGERHFYSATRFGDSIVRSSVPYSAELTASLQHDYTFFYYTAGILALLCVVMYFRSQLSHSEREKQRIKRQLTENAAHELKTPAAAIQGYLETLVSAPALDEEKRQEFLDRCLKQSQRMCSLLSDMSMLTRLDEAHISRPSTTIDAALTLRQIQEETASQFADKNILFQIHAPESLPLQGDASLVYSLFRNIVGNALFHASGATYFLIQARQSNGSLFFKFTDNGVGVAPEHLPHLFERFYRADKNRSRRLGGTGLGLAIAKNIAVQYGGSIAASATLGGGLTITVVLSASAS